MVKTLSAVYEDGVLKLTEPLALSEHQRVSVTISDESDDPAESFLDHEYMATIDAMDEPEPTFEEVRRALSGIQGSLSDAIREERDARG
ncbi:MAG TPA: antitoxin family protein [Bryobacteraceae bacterium]|nr:antitoxin family protein [Bryobacteraceae bacterium]